VNKNRSQQEHASHGDVGENQQKGYREHPRGGKEVKTNEQKKDKPDQAKVILKPLLEGTHGSQLAYFEVARFAGEENLSDQSRKAIRRNAFSAP
jgi:hypothetical protein